MPLSDAKPVGEVYPVVKRGEICLVTLDLTAYHEQQGRRSVLIVYPAAFNEITRTPIVLPITTGGSFARRRGFESSSGGRSNLPIITAVIRCDQLHRRLDSLSAERQACRNGHHVARSCDDLLASDRYYPR